MLTEGMMKPMNWSMEVRSGAPTINYCCPCGISSVAKSLPFLQQVVVMCTVNRPKPLGTPKSRQVFTKFEKATELQQLGVPLSCGLTRAHFHHSREVLPAHLVLLLTKRWKANSSSIVIHNTKKASSICNEHHRLDTHYTHLNVW